MNVNRCELSGNVTRDGELKSTLGGTAVLTFGLAFNDRKRDGGGNWVDVPNFIDCVIYGKMAESLAEYVTKGKKLFVAGKLHYSSWAHKDGSRRSKIEIVIDCLDFAQTGQKQADTASQAPNQAQEPVYKYPEQEQVELYDEDIPF